MRSCAVHHSSRAVISEWRISINTNLVEPNVRRFYEIFCALSDLTAAHTHTLVKSILACYSGTYTLIAASSPDILANALSLLHGYAEDDDDLFNTPHIFANDVMIRMPFILKDFVKRINTARSKVCGKCIFYCCCCTCCLLFGGGSATATVACLICCFLLVIAANVAGLPLLSASVGGVEDENDDKDE